MNHVKKYGIVLAFVWPQLGFAEEIDVTMHYVGPTEGQVWLGVQQGIEEANLQGGFLGQKYQLEVVEPEALETTDIETVLLLATDDEFTMKVAQTDKYAAVPIINLNSTSDKLREACAKAQSWHQDFVKFAARQLNSRFEKNQGEEMSDDAWAGWAGTKMIADSVVQTMQYDAAFMLNHLKTDLVFDGQKGDNANFRENGQLRQILLLVDNDNKAPLRGFKGGLDSLGKVTCK